MSLNALIIFPSFHSSCSSLASTLELEQKKKFAQTHTTHVVDVATVVRCCLHTVYLDSHLPVPLLVQCQCNTDRGLILSKRWQQCSCCFAKFFTTFLCATCVNSQDCEKRRLCASRHGIQNSMEAILTCYPALSIK